MNKLQAGVQFAFAVFAKASTFVYQAKERSTTHRFGITVRSVSLRLAICTCAPKSFSQPVQKVAFIAPLCQDSASCKLLAQRSKVWSASLPSAAWVGERGGRSSETGQAAEKCSIVRRMRVPSPARLAWPDHPQPCIQAFPLLQAYLALRMHGRAESARRPAVRCRRAATGSLLSTPQRPQAELRNCRRARALPSVRRTRRAQF